MLKCKDDLTDTIFPFFFGGVSQYGSFSTQMIYFFANRKASGLFLAGPNMCKKISIKSLDIYLKWRYYENVAYTCLVSQVGMPFH